MTHEGQSKWYHSWQVSSSALQGMLAYIHKVTRQSLYIHILSMENLHWISISILLNCHGILIAWPKPRSKHFTLYYKMCIFVSHGERAV